jgi:hypothetical protein
MLVPEFSNRDNQPDQPFAGRCLNNGPDISCPDGYAINAQLIQDRFDTKFYVDRDAKEQQHLVLRRGGFRMLITFSSAGDKVNSLYCWTGGEGTHRALVDTLQLTPYVPSRHFGPTAYLKHGSLQIVELQPHVEAKLVRLAIDHISGVKSDLAAMCGDLSEMGAIDDTCLFKGGCSW